MISFPLPGICERLVSDLVQGIGGVRDQLTEEDFLVGVECVDDEGHELGNLSLKCECFNFFSHGFCDIFGYFAMKTVRVLGCKCVSLLMA